MLHIGHKYQVHALRDDAIPHFRSQFPSELEGWDETITKPWQSLRPSEVRRESIEYILIESANLASDCDLLDLLPSIFLGLCDVNLESIFTGYYGPNGIPVTLSPLNLRRFLVGLNALRTAQHRETFGYLEDLPVRGCSSEKRCQRFRDHQFREYVEPPATLRPVTAWNGVWDESLCDECRDYAYDTHNEGRQRVWDSLPELFGFPPWEEIAL